MPSRNHLQHDTNHLIAVSKTGGFNESTHNRNDDAQEVMETRLEEISVATPYDERDQPDDETTRSYKVGDMRAHFEAMMKINKSFSDEKDENGKCDSIVEDMKAHFEKMSKVKREIAAEKKVSAVGDKKAHFEKIIKINKDVSVGKSGGHDSIVDELKARFNKMNKINKEISENTDKKGNHMEQITSSSNNSKKTNTHYNTSSMHDAVSNKEEKEETMNNLLGSILAKREMTLDDLSNDIPSDESVSHTEEVIHTNTRGKVTEQLKNETETNEASKSPTTNDTGTDDKMIVIEIDSSESTNTEIEAAAGVPMKSSEQTTSSNRSLTKKKKMTKCTCLGVLAIIIVMMIGIGLLSYFMIFTTSESRGQQVSPPVMSTNYPSESPTGQSSELDLSVPASSITSSAPTMFPESSYLSKTPSYSSSDQVVTYEPTVSDSQNILPTSRNPTKKPSLEPSPHPTDKPSYKSVTDIPARSPVADLPDPLLIPTRYPTVDLTMTLTNTPTKTPFVTPSSSHPTVQPSNQPTAVSSISQTVTTTSTPTPQPTTPLLLTNVPTYSPSQIITSLAPTTTPPTPTPSYQLIQIGQPIAGIASNELFGYSLSLSHNGTKVGIGSPFHDGPAGDQSGLVVIYERTTDANNGDDDDDDNDEITNQMWRQTLPNIYGRTPNEWVGWSVSQSSDGDWIAVNGALNSPAPYIKVFGSSSLSSVDNQQWVSRGDPIASTRGFGLSVSLSRNGSSLAVGGRYRARSYRYDDEDLNAWVQVGGDIEESLVAYVAMAGDGKSMVVGCPGDDSKVANAGRVRVFEIDEGANEVRRRGQAIYGDEANDNFGHSVSLSYDGKTVALGSYAANYVKVFVYDDDKSLWIQSGDDIVGGSLDNKFGLSLSLSKRGDRLVVGSPLYDNDRGRAIVYQIDHADDDDKLQRWNQIGDPILGEATNDQEAYTVSMSEDGDYVAVAALKADRNGLEDNGSVRVFKIV